MGMGGSVVLRPGEFAFEAEFRDEPIRANRALRDVRSLIAALKLVLGDNTTEAADRRQLQPVGIRVRLDAERVHARLESGHVRSVLVGCAER